MYFIKIDNLDTASKLSKICEKYKNQIDTNICYGRYIIDGASILGVSSLIGHTVRINPIVKGDVPIMEFFEELTQIGCWDDTTEQYVR